MISHCDDQFILVVNAGRKDIDQQILRAGLSQVCTIEVLEERALLALQGPEAEGVLACLDQIAQLCVLWMRVGS